jgi:hypothetical protein
VNWKATLKTNALSIAIGSFAIGVASGGASLMGFFDNQIRYCDPITNPCTTVTIPDWFGDPPPDAKFVRLFSGNKVSRVFFGILSPTAFAVCVAAALVAAENQRVIDERLSAQEFLEAIQKQLLTDEEIQKLAIASDMRVQDFRRELIDGYAALLLEKHPELIERFAPKPAPTSSETETVWEASPKADSPTQSSQSHDAPNEPDEQKLALPESKDDESNVFPQTTIQFSVPAPSIEPPNVLHQSEAEAIKILDALAGSHRSLLLIGGTGAGKSVTECYLLTQLFRRNPKNSTWAISVKNDSFCGLDRKGRVVLFDRKTVEESFNVLARVHGIYDERRRLPESKRKGLPPVRLILADWLSVNLALEEMKKNGNKIVQESDYQSKCSDIVYNGRDMNVCLIADLQSYNLAALGLKADRNSRKNFNLVALGNYYIEEDGSINESYGVVENMILDKNIIPDENERARLIEIFRQLKPISKEHHRPILFTTLEPARVVLLPDLRAYKAGEIPRLQLDTSAYTPQQLEKIFSLEFDIERKETAPNEAEQQPNDTNDSSSLPEQKIKEELLRCFKDKGWVKIGSIRSDCKGLRKLTKDVNEVRPILFQLKQEGLVDVQEDKDEFLVIERDS